MDRPPSSDASDSFRASDSDREHVAERLRHATAEGRLSADELEKRLQTLFAARTYGELDVLLADLPAGRWPSGRRVQIARWAAAIGAFTVMLAALGMLGIARLHSAAWVAVGRPGGVRVFKFPGAPPGQLKFPGAPPSQLKFAGSAPSQLKFAGPPLRQFKFPGPLLADPHQGLFIAAAVVGALGVLLVCGALLWMLMESRRSAGRPTASTSRFRWAHR